MDTPPRGAAAFTEKKRERLTKYSFVRTIKAVYKNVCNIVKGSEKEEYAYTISRESGTQAGMPLKIRYAEGSFGTGMPRRRRSCVVCKRFPDHPVKDEKMCGVVCATLHKQGGTAQKFALGSFRFQGFLLYEKELEKGESL